MDHIYCVFVAMCSATVGWFGLLRGKGPHSQGFLKTVRFVLFLIYWYPIFKFHQTFSLLCLIYVPSYLDLSEFTGRRSSDWFKASIVGKLFHDYFDCSLVKTVDIKVDQCILAMHPHGVLPFGGVVNVNTNQSGFEEQFPSLKKRVIAAATMVSLTPLFRDLVLAVGVVDCSRHSFENFLRKGYTVGVFVGGAIEALFSDPNDAEETLDLRRKKGFIRLAMIHNIPVVPVYTFNEVNHIYQVNDKIIGKLPVLSTARRIFNRISGLILPIFVPVLKKGQRCVSVVGEPIYFKMKVGQDEPSEEELQLAMEKYIDIVQKLYNEHAPKYNTLNIRKLIIN